MILNKWWHIVKQTPHFRINQRKLNRHFWNSLVSDIKRCGKHMLSLASWVITFKSKYNFSVAVFLHRVILCPASEWPCGHRLRFPSFSYNLLISMLFLLEQTKNYQIRQMGVGPCTNLQQIGTNDMEWLHRYFLYQMCIQILGVPCFKGYS